MDVIKLRINCSKIEKARLYKGKQGTYLNAVLIPVQNPQYDDDYMVCQEVSEEERNAGKKGPIIGNAKILVSRSRKPEPGQRPAAKPAAKPQPEDDDVPFRSMPRSRLASRIYGVEEGVPDRG